MTFSDYLKCVVDAARAHPEWRLGQTYFNTLHDVNPSLARKVVRTNNDCYYNDLLIEDFLIYVEAKW